MTVIAYKDGVLAADGRLCESKGFIWTDKCVKVFRLKDGSLFGAAGDNATGERLLTALNAGELTPSLGEDGDSIDAIRVAPNGDLFMWDNPVWSRFPEPYLAIGAGRQAAAAALILGCSARTAVRAAIMTNINCGGKVHSVKLKGIK